MANLQYEVADGEFLNSTFRQTDWNGGDLRLENCHFGAGADEDAIGVDATGGPSFLVRGCTFRGFASAIVSLAVRTSQLAAVCNSTFEDCKLAVDVRYTALAFHGTTFAGYTEAAIRWPEFGSPAALVDISVRFCSFTPAESFTGAAIQLYFEGYTDTGREFVSLCFNGNSLPQIELDGGGATKWVFSDLSFAAPQPNGGSGVWVGADLSADPNYAPSLPAFAYGVAECSISSVDAECPDDFFAVIVTEPPEATSPTPIQPLPNEPSPVTFLPASTVPASPAQTDVPPPASLTPEISSGPPTATQEFTDANTRPKRWYVIYRMVAFTFSLD
jgi:hypothetical protein